MSNFLRHHAMAAKTSASLRIFPPSYSTRGEFFTPLRNFAGNTGNAGNNRENFSNFKGYSTVKLLPSRQRAWVTRATVSHLALDPVTRVTQLKNR